MEAMISNLVQRFEKGALTRRELTQAIVTLASAGAGAGAAVGAAASTALAQSAPAAGGLKGTKIDHISIQVADLPRSVAFYQKMFGLTVVSEDKPNEIVRLGGAGKTIVSLHHKNPTGIVDHFAIGVENFNKDAVTQKLKQLGSTPEDNLDAGFHILDPAGISVQIVGG